MIIAIYVAGLFAAIYGDAYINRRDKTHIPAVPLALLWPLSLVCWPFVLLYNYVRRLP
jgi:hypothetical protein